MQTIEINYKKSDFALSQILYPSFLKVNFFV